ncbi:hypothetical protein GWI33_018195 [Rhynchophorus ferrugineus]|uniref:Uncharacterized protein n=1 Tax=Rhynchophorus ferrugineus TaxID=354439 RepID=A0A834HU82_RHYFE|nr:hypothetical protein GWI33_018195 [Rhynchophorus ferrugineus]
MTISGNTANLHQLHPAGPSTKKTLSISPRTRADPLAWSGREHNSSVNRRPSPSQHHVRSSENRHTTCARTRRRDAAAAAASCSSSPLLEKKTFPRRPRPEVEEIVPEFSFFLPLDPQHDSDFAVLSYGNIRSEGYPSVRLLLSPTLPGLIFLTVFENKDISGKLKDCINKN